MSRRFFISSIGTGHGKTFVLQQLIAQCHHHAISVSAYKPLLSGYDPQDEQSDAALLLKALGKIISPENVQHHVPFRLKKPTSPDLAIQEEGVELSLDTVAATMQQRLQQEKAEMVFVEGAGGLLSPLTQQHSNMDLALRLQLPCILVADTRLGSISQTLSLLRVMEQWRVTVAWLVLSQSDEMYAMYTDEMEASLRAHRAILPEVVHLPRVDATTNQIPNMIERLMR